MRIKGLAITLAAVAVVLGIAAIVVVVLTGEPGSEQDQLVAGNSAEVSTQNQMPVTQPPKDNVNVVAEISGNSEGNDLTVSLGAERDTNFAIMNEKQGDVLTMKVESEQENKLEIGIMSVSSDQVYSEVIPDGTGEIKITVPADGEYRMFIKNHSSKGVTFRLILDKPLTGPLV